MREFIVHRRINLGSWRLAVAAGFSFKRRGEQTTPDVGPTEDDVSGAYRTPQYEAWLRNKARRRAYKVWRELST